MERVKSSDVLDVSHEVLAPFRARVLGVFRRVGPNAWDDYEFIKQIATSDTGAVPADGASFPTLDVLAMIPVQLEGRGVEVRLRSDGKVLRVRFLPGDADVQELSRRAMCAFEPRLHGRLLRQYFLERYLRPVGEGSLKGASAVIVGKLTVR